MHTFFLVHYYLHNDVASYAFGLDTRNFKRHRVKIQWYMVESGTN